MDKYIIVEIIPTALDPKYGDIAQLSALKIEDLKLLDRFDYRLNEEKIPLKEMVEMISYDKKAFTYMDTTKEIIDEFKKWSENYKLLILNNSYTLNYLSDLINIKEDISSYLNIPYTDDIIDKIIEKYQLQPSDYIVDLLYEALIYESNNQNS